MSWVSNYDEYHTSIQVGVNPEYTTEFPSSQIKTENGSREISLITSEAWISTEIFQTIHTQNQTRPNVLTTDLEGFKDYLSYRLDVPIDLDTVLWNNSSYVISEPYILSETPKTITVNKSDFFSILSHTARITKERLQSSKTETTTKYKNLYNQQSKILQNIQYNHRPIGTAFLTVLKQNGTYYMLIGERSQNVAFWPDVFSVFPAGFLQPINQTETLTIKEHLLKNAAEEFFNSSQKIHTLNKSNPIQSLSQLFLSGDAWFSPTGFGIETTLLSGEMTGLLCIEDEKYSKYILDEFQKSSDIQNPKAIPLIDATKTQIESLILSRKFTPQSLFAIVNGLRLLNQTKTENDSVTTPPLSLDVSH